VKILSIFGTRPEAIKMAPVLQCLSRSPNIDSIVCVTGQHHSMLWPVLDFFQITPDYTLDVMSDKQGHNPEPNQGLNQLSARLFAQLDPILATEKPDRVLVHGDTTTAAIAAMAATHHRIPVAHIEAGLRTGNMGHPWPEEMNRRIIDMVSDHLFAPTPIAANNLMQEQVKGHVLVTGNTVIDALFMTLEHIRQRPAYQQALHTFFDFLPTDKKILLVTSHRRENIGTGIADICAALTQLSTRQDCVIVFPVHLNPAIRGPVEQHLSALPNVFLTEPLDYPHFVYLMQRAHAILTDSGGIQEEAVALGIPVMVMRERTERTEAIASGTACLVGTEPAHIVASVAQALDRPALHLTATSNTNQTNPYGDGHAAQRIVSALMGASATTSLPHAQTYKDMCL
jgi:UDP-N-acetylglucosamine 2-epimerase (non-hydrolysing)